MGATPTPISAPPRRLGRPVPARRPIALAGLFFLMVGWALLLVTPAGAQTAGRGVLVAEVNGPITPVTSNYLKDAIQEAGSYQALVVQLDTPGGLDTSMREIVQAFLGSEVPVIVFVYPQGARAASAGAIITFAGHVAAMSPGSAIGASTPVDLEGGDIEQKIINDAAAYAESIARLRGRNVEFATDTVREGRSVSATEALELGAVDLISGSLPELLETVDGREITVGFDDRVVTLETDGAPTEEFDPGILRRIQQTLADPNVAFLFMSLGTLMIVYEVASPGLGLGGALGIILVILALFSLSVLPVNAVGLVLLGLAVLLFIAEIFAPGVGVAAAGGTIALLLSGLFLVKDVPGLGVSLSLLIPVTLVVGGAVLVAGRLAVKARQGKPASTGPQTYIGREVTVGDIRGSTPQALLDGAWWNVRSPQPGLSVGDRVRITGFDGLDLLVEQVPPEPEPPVETEE